MRGPITFGATFLPSGEPLPGLADLIATFPEEERPRGDAFERTCRWFLRTDPHYAGRFRNVWLWNDWPERWGADAGIDLVAETVDGTLWAIQAKCYDPEHRISRRDVDTFLAESGRPHFGYRLLIASTDLIGATAKRTLQGQERPAGTLLLANLEASEVDWPASIELLDALDGAPIVHIEPKTPRPHQATARDAVLAGFLQSDRGQLVMACGTGKTLTSLFIANALEARRVLFLVPSLSLLSQVLREWISNETGPFDFLAVCSDDTVVHGPDDAVATTSDLSYPVTTDPTTIARFLRSRREGKRLVFATYQSSAQVARAMEFAAVPSFDLAVADEAHRLAGDTTGEFATILRGADERRPIRARKRLFMTATPRYFTGRVRRVAAANELELASMDDEELFGPSFHTLTFAEAIEQELLTDYQVAIIGVDDAQYREWAERGLFLRADLLPDMDARTLASHIGFAKAMRNFGVSRAISFHGRVAKARRFAEMLPRVIGWMPEEDRPEGTLLSDYVSGEMPVGQRRVKLRSLAAPPTDRVHLANARCLSEGVDVPALDCVAFIDPRRSEIDIIQAVGRAMRRSPEATIGTIVLPVFLAGFEDPDAALEDSSFKPVWDVLKALRAHDSDLGAQLDELRRELGRPNGVAGPLPDRIHVVVPAGVDARFVAAIHTRLIESTTATWDEWFGLLSAFAERHGHSRVPARHLEDGKALGSWVNNQRTRREILPMERRQVLESLPGWAWDAQQAAWDEQFALLLKYVAEVGGCLFPVDHEEDGVPLGRWVARQRTRQESLSEDRRARLEALPGWTWDAQQAAWDRGFALLSAYAAEVGDCLVPVRHQENGVPLGRWVARQRRDREELSEERRQRLEELPGWVWSAQEAAWEQKFAALVAYAAREGDCLVPARHREGEEPLGAWVNSQRTTREALPEDRRQRLEAIPGWVWDAHAAAWEEKFALLLAFATREGHARVPAGHMEGDARLGQWVTVQRSRRDALSDERRARLEAAPGWAWDAQEAAWEEKLVLLQGFAAREGHARVPIAHREGRVRLGQWVANQRAQRAELPVERRRRLEAIPGWEWRLRGQG